MKVVKEATVMPYFKSGDDMHSCLEQNDNNPIQALRSWADQMQYGAD